MFPDPADAPVPVNNAFYPDDDRIYFHIYEAVFTMKQSKFDQEALSIAIEKWQQESPRVKILFHTVQGKHSRGCAFIVLLSGTMAKGTSQEVWQ
jgi:hypothetical protein